MKVVLILLISGIYNGPGPDSGTEFRHQMEKQYSSLEDCVHNSIIMRKILKAEDNLQIRQTDVYAHCEINPEGLAPRDYNAAKNKLRRLEKFYTTAKW